MSATAPLPSLNAFEGGFPVTELTEKNYLLGINSSIPTKGIHKPLYKILSNCNRITHGEIPSFTGEAFTLRRKVEYTNKLSEENRIKYLENLLAYENELRSHMNNYLRSYIMVCKKTQEFKLNSKTMLNDDMMYEIKSFIKPEIQFSKRFLNIQDFCSKYDKETMEARINSIFTTKSLNGFMKVFFEILGKLYQFIIYDYSISGDAIRQKPIGSFYYPNCEVTNEIHEIVKTFIYRLPNEGFRVTQDALFHVYRVSLYHKIYKTSSKKDKIKCICEWIIEVSKFYHESCSDVKVSGRKGFELFLCDKIVSHLKYRFSGKHLQGNP